MRIAIELFLFLLVIFNLVTISFHWVVFGFSRELLHWVWDDLLLAAFFSLLLVFIHALAVRKSPYRYIKGALCVEQSRTMELALPYTEAMRRCVSSLDLIKEVRIKEVNYMKGKIEAWVPADSKHTPQVITFTLSEIDNSHTRVTVVSRPVSYRVRIDFGKSLANVEIISGFLIGTHESSSFLN